MVINLQQRVYEVKNSTISKWEYIVNFLIYIYISVRYCSSSVWREKTLYQLCLVLQQTASVSLFLPLLGVLLLEVSFYQWFVRAVEWLIQFIIYKLLFVTKRNKVFILLCGSVLKKKFCWLLSNSPTNEVSFLSEDKIVVIKII